MFLLIKMLIQIDTQGKSMMNLFSNIQKFCSQHIAKLKYDLHVIYKTLHINGHSTK